MAQTLAQLVRQKYPGAYDDMSDAELEAAVDRKYPGAYDDIPRTTERPEGARAALAGAQAIGETPWYAKRPRGWKGALMGAVAAPWAAPISVPAGFYGKLPSVSEVVAAIPDVAGAAGGVIGGVAGNLPGALKGAALGGAGGEALQQLAETALYDQPPVSGPGEAAVKIAGEAAKQAILEGTGAGLAKGARVLGRGLVEQAVRPPMGLQREFPEVIETIVKERLPVGKGYIPERLAKHFPKDLAFLLGRTKGSIRASQLLAEESQAVKRLLGKATAGGKTFETSKLAMPVLDLFDEIIEQEALAPGSVKQLEKLVDNFLAKKGRAPLNPFDVQRLKQEAQALAKPIYKAIGKGEPIRADQRVAARFHSAVASGAKEAMETIPGVAKGEARKRSLIGAKRAITQAEQRRLSLMAEGAVASAGTLGALLGPGSGLDDRTRNAVLAWGFARGILHPRQLSREGMALTAVQTQVILRQFPRLADLVFNLNEESREAGVQ